MKNRVWIVLFFLSITLNFFLVIKIITSNADLITPKKLGGEYSLNKTVLTVLVFMSKWSCDLCLGESEIWEKLVNNFSDQIQVVGVVKDSSEKEIIKEKFKINIPFITDKKGKLLKKYNVKLLPFKIIITKKGDVVYKSPLSSLKIIQENFYFQVAEILNKIKVNNLMYQYQNNL